MPPSLLKNTIIGVALGFILGAVCEAIYAKTESRLLAFGVLLVGAFIFGDEKTKGWRILPFLIGAPIGGAFVVAIGRAFDLSLPLF